MSARPRKRGRRGGGGGGGGGQEPKPSIKREDLESKTVSELKEMAAELDLDSKSLKKKEELIDAVLEAKLKKEGFVEVKGILDVLPEGRQVMLKLSIPVEPNLYAPAIAHPNVLRVVALSGGYSTDEACEHLAKNRGMIASFSRGLLQDLRKGQSDEEFDRALGDAIDQIAAASAAG